MELLQVQFPAQLTKMETRADGSIKVIIETQELSGDKAAMLFNYRNALGYVTFTPNAIDEVEVPKEKVAHEGKSPSERMRGVLWHLWDNGDKSLTFDQYYRNQMERIIETLKDKLN